MSASRCGVVALAGRPNTGKSSLFNRLVGEKLAIVSPRPQSTRHVVRGVHTTAECQYVFVDSPGWQTRYGGVLNRALNRRAEEAARDADVVLFVVEAMRFGAEDRAVLARLATDAKIVCAVNKVDRLARATDLLPFLARLGREERFAELVAVSARTGRNVPELLKVLAGLLPEGPALYDPSELTDQDQRFFAAEILREKIFLFLGEELPYRCEVVVDRFEEAEELRRIGASVWVERESQKAIVIGRGGGMLKRIASAARLDMERLFGGRVYLEVWVRVRRAWTDDTRALRRLGYV
jgi:GTP-binding protein Era